jgi:FeS assembly SUF system regulator
MIILSKLTDYGLVLMSHIAHGQGRSLRTARDLAAESRVPLFTVSKLLKELLRSGLLVSHRGSNGGYYLAKDPNKISVLDVITALDGPMAFTECSSHVPGLCSLEPCCLIKNNQRIISDAIRGLLERIKLLDLVQPLQLTTIKDAHDKLVSTIDRASGRMQ